MFTQRRVPVLYIIVFKIRFRALNNNGIQHLASKCMWNRSEKLLYHITNEIHFTVKYEKREDTRAVNENSINIKLCVLT